MRRIITTNRTAEPKRVTETEKPKNKGIFSGIVEDVSARASRVGEQAKKVWGEQEGIGRREKEGQQTWLDSYYQAMAGVGSVATQVVGEAFGGAVKGVANIGAAVRSGDDKTMSEQYQQDIQDVKDLAQFAASSPLGKQTIEKAGDAVQPLVEKWTELQKDNPRLAANLVATGRMADFITTFAAPGLGKKASQELIPAFERAVAKIIPPLPPPGSFKLAGEVIDITAKTAETGAKAPGLLSGAKGMVTEFAERIPRAAEKLKMRAEEAALRAREIEQASPELASAIKSGLDKRTVGSVLSADDATRQAQKEMVDIAGRTPEKLGPIERPDIVAGKAADEIFDVLEKQRKNIGEQIGEASSKLPTEYVSMGDAVEQMDSVLTKAGIKIKEGALDFGGSKFTPAQRTKIQQLYDLSIEGINKNTAKQIHAKDQMFSQLQREARMEGMGDILLDLPNGNKISMFRVFRDIYRNKLDELSPEMRVLNRQYRDAVRLAEDIENSIFKTPNYNVTDVADPAEFAKVNLRRIMGESQSAPAYAAIMKKALTKAQELGYKGADPTELIYFAQKLRDLFPDIIPPTGFTGSVKTGVTSAALEFAGLAMKLGRPDLKDQQKALRELIESLFKAKTKKAEGIIEKKITDIVEETSTPMKQPKKSKAKKVPKE